MQAGLHAAGRGAPERRARPTSTRRCSTAPRLRPISRRCCSPRSARSSGSCSPSTRCCSRYPRGDDAGRRPAPGRLRPLNGHRGAVVRRAGPGVRRLACSGWRSVMSCRCTCSTRTPAILSFAFPVGSQRIVTWQSVALAVGGRHARGRAWACSRPCDDILLDASARPAPRSAPDSRARQPGPGRQAWPAWR